MAAGPGGEPGTQILMVTVYQDPETTFDALAAGVHGYLVKPVMEDQLRAAIPCDSDLPICRRLG
jgi:DNA-binding NarL/FixJ family response regulator